MIIGHIGPLWGLLGTHGGLKMGPSSFRDCRDPKFVLRNIWTAPYISALCRIVRFFIILRHLLFLPPSQGCDNQRHLHNLSINKSLCCIVASNLVLFLDNILPDNKGIILWMNTFPNKVHSSGFGRWQTVGCFDFQYFLIRSHSLPNIGYSENVQKKYRPIQSGCNSDFQHQPSSFLFLILTFAE